MRHGNPNVLVVVMVKGRLASGFCSPTLIWASPVADATVRSNAIFAKRILMSPYLVHCQRERLVPRSSRQRIVYCQRRC